MATLTVLLLPRLQLKTRTLVVGDIAPADIKAHTDFLLEDEVSAQKKRQEAEERVLPLYDFDQHAIDEIDRRLKWALQTIEAAYQVRPPELSGALQDARSAPLTPEEAARIQGLAGVQTTMSREAITTSPFFAEREQEFRRILGVELGAETLTTLRQLQYTPRLRQGVIDALATVMQRGVVGYHDLLAGHRERGVVFRDVRTKQELVITDPGMISEVDEAAAALTAAVLAANSPYPVELQPVIAAIARQLLRPNLTFNKEE